MSNGQASPAFSFMVICRLAAQSGRLVLDGKKAVIASAAVHSATDEKRAGRTFRGWPA